MNRDQHIKNQLILTHEAALASQNHITVEALRERMAADDLKVEALSVVEFHDTDTSARWFMRPHHVVAYIAAVMCDGQDPLQADKLLAQVREDFGPKAEVIW